MKTINERAEAFASIYSWEQQHFISECYITGAKEQRDIDIDRAWQWMRQRINLIGSEMELHSQFVKAMKHE